MKRPPAREIKFPQKRRILRKHNTNQELEAAANAAIYAPSNYHCRIDGKLARRVKPATPCPREFTFQQARDAIRRAILAGNVSRKWIDGFPKHIWHKEGDVWYEACTEAGNLGTYHGYPIDASNLPAGLKA